MAKTTIPLIIQATNKSNIMKEKVLARIKKDYGFFEYLVERLRLAWSGPIVLATSSEKIDDSLDEEGQRLGIEVFRAEQDNVTLRLYKVATALNCQNFVRIFGSYPLTDTISMKKLVKEHLSGKYEYSYNGHRNGVLWGMESEVISIYCLERLLSLNLSEEQLETATFFIRQNPNMFHQFKLDSPILRPSYKVALENERDLVLLQDIVQHVPDPSINSVIKYLDSHPILAASNYESPVKEIGLEKLIRYPKKISALKEADDHIDISYPVSVELSLTNRCNLNCVYCSDKDLRKRQGTIQTLDKHILFQLFDDLKKGGTQGIVIEGGGEPIIHPEFEEIIEYLSSIRMATGLITNGTKSLSAKIISQFEWIRISLDASTQEEYKSLKKIDCYEQVLSNIYNFARHCPTVGVGYVVTNKNVGEIESLVLRLREYGVSYIQLRPVVDNPELLDAQNNLSYLEFYQTSNFAIIMDGLVENAYSGNSGLPCWAHSLTTVISADGAVYLCGRLNIHDWIEPIGNIRSESFNKIWTGKNRLEQANQVLKADFCQAFCPQCRLSKFNKMVFQSKILKTPNFI